MEKDTPFVRQNTPHPKELKLKAHKLFAKEKSKLEDSGNLDTVSEESSSKPSSGKKIKNSTTMDNISEARTEVVSNPLSNGIAFNGTTTPKSVSQDPIFDKDLDLDRNSVEEFLVSPCKIIIILVQISF